MSESPMIVITSFIDTKVNAANAGMGLVNSDSQKKRESAAQADNLDQHSLTVGCMSSKPRNSLVANDDVLRLIA